MQKHSSSSHVKIHHRNDVTSHSYSQSHSSERKSVSQRDVFHASSSAPNRWHTATNSKGNLVIAKKTIAKEPKSADYSKAKKKIRYILTEYKKRIMDKKNTQLDDVDDWTSDIMKVCEKYKRGDYSAMQSSTKSAKAKEEAKKPKQGPAKQKSPAQPSTSQSSTITAKPKSKPNDKKNTEAETTAKKFEKRMTNEVMNLYKTYGLVVSQPTSKRTPKKVERFCDLDFDTPRTRSRTHRALHRPDETPKQVKPKQKKASPANAFKKPVSAFKVIENAPPGNLLESCGNFCKKSCEWHPKNHLNEIESFFISL